jgi:hypothetical protein
MVAVLAAPIGAHQEVRSAALEGFQDPHAGQGLRFMRDFDKETGHVRLL